MTPKHLDSDDEDDYFSPLDQCLGQLEESFCCDAQPSEDGSSVMICKEFDCCKGVNEFGNPPWHTAQITQQNMNTLDFVCPFARQERITRVVLNETLQIYQTEKDLKKKQQKQKKQKRKEEKLKQKRAQQASTKLIEPGHLPTTKVVKEQEHHQKQYREAPPPPTPPTLSSRKRKADESPNPLREDKKIKASEAQTAARVLTRAPKKDVKNMTQDEQKAHRQRLNAAYRAKQKEILDEPGNESKKAQYNKKRNKAAKEAWQKEKKKRETQATYKRDSCDEQKQRQKKYRDSQQ